MPLALRECAPNDSQQPQDQGKKGVSQKKINRPWAAKSKYTGRKGSKERKSDIKEKEELKYPTKKSYLEKLKLKNIEIPSYTAGLVPGMAITTLHLDKVVSCSIPPSQPKSSFRDRTNSCKVSIKKVFPQAVHENKMV